MQIRAMWVAMALVSSGLAVAPQPASAAAPNFVSVFIDTPGPRGSIAAIGDSLMLGSAYEAPLVPGWGPSLAQMLADRGWGPVHMAAGVGFQAGSKVPANNPGANMSIWLTNQRLSGFDPEVIVVSMGPNDIIACNGSVDCAADDIRGFMDTAGNDHEVWWSLQTTAIQSNQDAWNQALHIVEGERPNLTLWDWPAIRVAQGIPIAGDNTHLPGPNEYRQRSALMADDVTTRLGGSRQIIGGGEVTPPVGGASYVYQPVPPTRVVDTRLTGDRVAAGGTLTVDLSMLAPTLVGPDAAAAAVNVTSVDQATGGFLTVYPCGTERPLASSVNFLAGQPRGALATTLLRQPDRALCVFSNTATNVVVDLQGVFAPSDGLLFESVTPDRVLDTRVTGRKPTIAIPAPPGAKAVAATLTVTGSNFAGFLTAYPCSLGFNLPVVSSVNWLPGETVAGAVFVPVADDGTFCLTANAPVDVIVDVTGVFGGATGNLRFTPVPPTRMVDTRVGTGGWRGHQAPGQTIEIGAAPEDAVAVTGTITMIDPGVSGYVTGTICGQPVGATSSVNGAGSSVMANSLTVELSPGGNLCITSLVATHTLFDTTGWWKP